MNQPCLYPQFKVLCRYGTVRTDSHTNWVYTQLPPLVRADSWMPKLGDSCECVVWSKETGDFSTETLYFTDNCFSYFLTLFYILRVKDDLQMLRCPNVESIHPRLRVQLYQKWGEKAKKTPRDMQHPRCQQNLVFKLPCPLNVLWVEDFFE